MSRSNYSDDIGNWALIRWRGAVKSAINGARGQKLLREIVAAMDAMSVKELTAHELEAEGNYCTLGVVGCARGIDMSQIDPEDPEQVSKLFGIAPALAQEIVFENDECINDWNWTQVEICGPMRAGYPDWGRHSQSVRTPSNNVAARRWRHMRDWAAANIHDDAP